LGPIVFTVPWHCTKELSINLFHFGSFLRLRVSTVHCLKYGKEENEAEIQIAPTWIMLITQSKADDKQKIDKHIHAKSFRPQKKLSV